jgi:hypothetical protein
MGGAVPPLPQYAFMAWCSVRGSTGTGSIVSINEPENQLTSPTNAISPPLFTKQSRLLFGKVVAAYCNNQTKFTAPSFVFLSVKRGGT